MTALRLESMRQDTIQVAQNGCIHGSHWMTMSTQTSLLGSTLGCYPWIILFTNYIQTA